MHTWYFAPLLTSFLLASGLSAGVTSPAAPAAQAGLAPQVQSILDEARDKAEAVQKAFQAHRAAGKDPNAFVGNLRKEIEAYGLRLENEQDPQLRQALLIGRLQMELMSMQAPTAVGISQLVAEVSPVFAGWGVWPDMMFWVMENVKEPMRVKAYLKAALEGNPAPGVRCALLANEFGNAIGEGDLDRSSALLEQLRKEFPASSEAADCRRDHDNYMKTRPGIPAPAFSIPSLEDPVKAITLAGLKGQYVLVDFWATWCSPCKGELPHLHKAWERFRGGNFVILSISHDRKAQDVQTFRKQAATPMPWLHGFDSGEGRKALAEAYGVFGIPKPVLIGPDGRILTTQGLRGQELEKTLTTYLGH